MIRKTYFIATLFALALQWPLDALAKKEVTITQEQCRANCYAKAKKCAEAGVVNVAACVATKNICLEDICGSLSSAKSGTGIEPPESPPAESKAE